MERGMTEVDGGSQTSSRWRVVLTRFEIPRARKRVRKLELQRVPWQYPRVTLFRHYRESTDWVHFSVEDEGSTGASQRAVRQRVDRGSRWTWVSRHADSVRRPDPDFSVQCSVSTTVDSQC